MTARMPFKKTDHNPATLYQKGIQQYNAKGHTIL